MPKEQMYIDIETAREFSCQVFQAVGVPREDALLVTNNMIDADLRGLGSHGISRLLVYTTRIKDGWVNPKPNIKILHERGGLLHLDGDNGLGAVVGVRAMDMCIDKAVQSGVAVCSVQKANHFGIAWFYTRRAVERDMIGIASSNNPPNMAPWGGRESMIGTNPFSIAVPAHRHKPLVVDMSCSIVARGKLNLAEIENQPIPLGWAIDPQGRPTTNATEGLKGAVLPFGEHKGYGIALIVDVLSGILSGAAFSTHVGQLWGNNESIQDIGLFFQVVDISATGDPRAFKERVDILIDELKACPPAEGVKEVLIPGEIEFAKEEINRKKGLLIGLGVKRDLTSLKNEFKIDIELEKAITITN
jgi:LDH2 family malate/lactate/ureidoglycolate dehydrogenase